ncbi:HTH domain-containing protein [Bifidobacterium sp. CP2]|uniref:HTH domain-containing protein n=1 Tax=Bifidobacterium sp. CP2 TaxID=2809025 RepID=UPI001F0AF4C6|nr:HTH domain-containing protein [Bifidobacterium sp. CP2]
MVSGGGKFSPEEVTYLKSLPAVVEASPKRITYAEAFKRYCIIQYNQGGSPVKLFREAGLDPALIGYKRIERCFARWREDYRDLLSDQAEGTSGEEGVGGERRRWTSRATRGRKTPASFAVDASQRAIVLPAASGETDVAMGVGGSDDIRDLLISQQVRRIDELEHKVAMLTAMLDAEKAAGRVGEPETGDAEAADGGEETASLMQADLHPGVAASA